MVKTVEQVICCEPMPGPHNSHIENKADGGACQPRRKPFPFDREHHKP